MRRQVHPAVMIGVLLVVVVVAIFALIRLTGPHETIIEDKGSATRVGSEAKRAALKRNQPNAGQVSGTDTSTGTHSQP